jgi:hypothetical protein
MSRNRFQDGTWSMYAKVDPAKGAFDVYYRDRQNVERRQRFGTREQADQMAEVTGGRVVPVVPRRFGLRPITGGAA